ncbi:MAG: methyltransferase domain-containing protein [Candidatus Dadabacteria bacterium]|nr:methyltransferase domain-containing protein [Candidatus Dadabacteria bacterium]NIS09774.1 methyltransferase domain-containing protein [Candidatus Dadabacteria bacterium]NIY22542.1 methyltransferase domain-containing protein [Candidatus Dadabacteria bacterium]
MKLFSALKYYLSSIPTLLAGVNFYSIPLMFLDGKMLLKTSAGINFYVRELIEIWTIKEVVLDRQYEDHRQLRPGDVVIDIGAAIGEFSIHAAKTAKTVYGFEIVDESIERMRNNMEINNCTNINLIQQGVESLNDIFSENSIDHCDFLKVDCEGCEYHIFKDVADEVLDKIDYMALEVHFFNDDMISAYKELTERLADKFNLIETPSPVHSNIAFLYAIRKNT